ncbi:Phenylalanyl-tRNA synthetase, beta subunit, partial [Candidatus Arthromitus sp. SFB-5]
REIKAIYGFDLKNPKFDFKYSGCKDINDLLSVDVQNKDCRRYSARVIENLKICDSPKFIQDRLIASGIRPINNIVDLTNYVMLEIGQPMHAFDYNVVSNSKIIVGNTINGDKFITLDGIERELDDSIICIKDSEKVLALGGIIGGENSKVNDDTKRIILESAN